VFDVNSSLCGLQSTSFVNLLQVNMSRQLSPIGAISPKQSPAAQHTIPVPLTITTSNLKSTITNLTSELSSLPGQSSLSWASKLLRRRTSKRPAGKLELGPSGAVVFRSRRSLDSISSATTSILGTNNCSFATAAD